jgi:hypothetical protein
METKDHLFELIKALSKSEKGYFKKVNAFHVRGDQNNYMLVFDTIDKMQVYSEEQLKKQLQGKVKSQLSYLKHYLYYQLLDSLDQYYQSSNVEINKWICKTEILYKKGLTDHAVKILEKAMDFAWKKEKFAYLLQLTRMRYDFLSEEENKELMLLQKEVLNGDLTNLRKKIDNLYEYLQLRIELNWLRAETGYARNKEQGLLYASLLQHPALSNESYPLSNSACYHFHTIRCMIFDYVHDYVHANESVDKVLNLIRAQPDLFEEAIAAKIQTLHRKCTIVCSLGNFKEAMEVIHQMREISTGHEKYKALIFQYGYHQEFQVYLWTGRFTEVTRKIPGFEEELRQHTHISKTFELRLLRQISESYFIQGKFEESLEWVNRAVNIVPLSFRHDVVSGIKIHEIFTHYELGNYRLIKSKIAAVEKYLRTKNKPFRFERYLLSFLEKLLSASSPAAQAELFRQARQAVETMFEDRTEAVPLKYFYLRAWVESKITKKSPGSILKKQLHEYHFAENHVR